jgi:cold shock CspA family protein
MIIGRVKFYNAEKQFGFIRDTVGGEFYFRTRDVVGEVTKGDSVEFIVDDGERVRGRTMVAKRIHRIVA